MADLAAQPSINDARTQALLALLQRLDAMDLTPLLVYRIDSVDASVLPWLAWQFDLNSEFWLLLDNVNQRTLLKEAILLHQRRGTPWAITTALASLGYPNATILEGQNSWGGSGWPATEGWAVNRIVIPIPTGGIPAGIPAQIIAAFNFFKHFSPLLIGVLSDANLTAIGLVSFVVRISVPSSSGSSLMRAGCGGIIVPANSFQSPPHRGPL
jgi:hypothetical protein